MKIVIYYDANQFNNKYYDEISSLERQLKKAGYEFYKQPYDDLKSFGHKRKVFKADGYIFTPGGIQAQRKIEKHWMHKYRTNHDLPIILYDFGEDFNDMSRVWLRWCFDNDLKPGLLPNWYSIVISVKEILLILDRKFRGENNAT